MFDGKRTALFEKENGVESRLGGRSGAIYNDIDTGTKKF